MTDSGHTQLEKDLAAMTQYTGPATELWRRALDGPHTTAARAMRFRAWVDRVSGAKWQWMQVAALVIMGCGVLWLALAQSLSRSGNASFAMDGGFVTQDSAYRYKSPGDAGPPRAANSMLGDIPVLGRTFDKSVRDRSEGFEGAGGKGMIGLEGGLTPFQSEWGGVASGKPPTQGESSAPRQVVRKAAVELHTRDVRAAFVKVQMLVSEAGGEYIEQSAISGQDEQMQADLTLRISASRVSEVLNALRDIGEVISQQLSGEDVTAQAVDIEARLSNERRVEAELLDLLESRKDAELKDVLELRRNIGQVREQIERLVAQQQHLSHLVSLATVLVIIRHEGQPEPKPEHTGIGAYFARVMGAAWESGITGLADSVAWIASTLLGGLIWWSIAGIALWAAWRKYRTLRARPQSEPRP